MPVAAYVPRAAAPLLVFSLISNLAILVNPLFMMQVLDRVVPSGNVATLLMLTGLALGFLVLQGLVEWGRDLALTRLARWGQQTGSAEVVRALTSGEATQDDVVRVSRFAEFLGGIGAVTALGLPWLPVFGLVLWIIHPAFLLLVCCLVAGLMGARWMATRLSAAAQSQAAGWAKAEQISLAHATGFASRLGVAAIEHNLMQRFLRAQRQRHDCVSRAEGAILANSSVSTVLRAVGQVLALALGAFLVTQEALSAGGMIAASLIVSRAFMALETTTALWPQLRMALADYRYLAALQLAPPGPDMRLPEWQGALRADGIIFPRGGGEPPMLDRVNLSLDPGETLAIVGGSGAGKTTLLQALAGVQPAPIGSVFFDESEVRGLKAVTLYQQTGFLPQRAELVPGTIAENIACFEAEIVGEKVVETAKLAGVHGLISALPDAYETDLSHAPFLLSAGQVQRVALARALYNKPRYLFLDEPNALLDGEGERALSRILMRLKAEGTTIVMVLHRSGLLGLCDKILQLEQGRVADFGARAEVLARISGGGRQLAIPLQETSLQDLRDWIASQFNRFTDEAFSQKAQLVAMELFRLLIANGASNGPRGAQVAFKFLNDNEVELSINEENGSELERKYSSLRTRLAGDKPVPGDLSQEERALAAVAQMSDRIEVRCGDDSTFCLVALSSNTLAPTQAARAH